MRKIKIAILAGSLRKESYNRKLALTIGSSLPDEFETHLIDISELPLYNEDLDQEGLVPAQWKALRKIVGEMDGFLFATPEYNRSYTPVIKNALDIASRPYGQNMWSGKPGAVISASPGRFGGFGANQHLRLVLSFLNVYTMQQPDGCFAGVHEMFDESGNPANEIAKSMVAEFASAFASWVQRFAN